MMTIHGDQQIKMTTWKYQLLTLICNCSKNDKKNNSMIKLFSCSFCKRTLKIWMNKFQLKQEHTFFPSSNENQESLIIEITIQFHWETLHNYFYWAHKIRLHRPILISACCCSTAIATKTYSAARLGSTHSETFSNCWIDFYRRFWWNLLFVLQIVNELLFSIDRYNFWWLIFAEIEEQRMNVYKHLYTRRLRLALNADV